MKIIVLAILLVFSGCSFFQETREPLVETQEVYIPIEGNNLEPPKVTMPDLPIYYLDEDSTPSEVAKAYVISIQKLKNEAIYRGLLLDLYRSSESE